MVPSDDAMGSMDWMSRGPASVRILSFFPIAANGPALEQISAAKGVCPCCTVRAACLSFGLNTTQDGIWGGTTLKETPRHAGTSGSRGRADVSAGQP